MKNEFRIERVGPFGLGFILKASHVLKISADGEASQSPLGPAYFPITLRSNAKTKAA